MSESQTPTFPVGSGGNTGGTAGMPGMMPGMAGMMPGMSGMMGEYFNMYLWMAGMGRMVPQMPGVSGGTMGMTAGMGGMMLGMSGMNEMMIPSMMSGMSAVVGVAEWGSPKHLGTMSIGPTWIYCPSVSRVLH